MKNWLIPTVRLPAQIKPKLIKAFELAQNVYISRNCSINAETGVTSFWWEISQKNWSLDERNNGQANGIVFFTWSERVTEQLVQYGLVGFYIVVVLGIGRAIRAIIQTGSEQIFIKDMPKPDSLLLI